MPDRWLMIGTNGDAKLVDYLITSASILPASVEVFAGFGLTQGMRLWAKQHSVPYQPHDFIKIKSLKDQKAAAKKIVDQVDGIFVTWDGTPGLPEEVIELAISAAKHTVVVVLDNDAGKMITVRYEFDDF